MWNIIEKDLCKVSFKGESAVLKLPLEYNSENGICYLHFMSTGDRNDSHGLFIDDLRAKVDSNVHLMNMPFAELQ
jgi:hypothetical protein